MTIFQILQVFHASLCPSGHGRYMKEQSAECFFHLSGAWQGMGVIWFLFHSAAESGGSFGFLILPCVLVQPGFLSSFVLFFFWKNLSAVLYGYCGHG